MRGLSNSFPAPRIFAQGWEGWAKGAPRFVFTWTTLLVTLACWGLTDVLWPTSTDLSQVPVPWVSSFRVLYFFETLSFGLGVSYLRFGFAALAVLHRSKSFALLAHLSMAWLMLAWWPEDNMYRLSSATDWARQSQLVWTFNISSMLAAAIVAAFAMAAYRNAVTRSLGGSR
jgi:hypothetical protein